MSRAVHSSPFGRFLPKLNPRADIKLRRAGFPFLGIDCDLIELNPDYIITAENRIAKSAGPLLAPLSFSHRDDDLFAGAA